MGGDIKRCGCGRPAKWEIRQAGTAEGQLACRMHTQRTLDKVLAGARPPRPMAEVFAIVVPV